MKIGELPPQDWAFVERVPNDPKVARRLVGQLMSMLALEREPFDGDMSTSAISLLGELEPKNATEGLLAVQMLGVHEVATRFLQLATVPGQTSEADAHVAKVTKLCRLFNEQLEAMTKLKGKFGQQKVTVEHVHVHNGGKAIVGNVNAGQGIEGEVEGQVEK